MAKGKKPSGKTYVSKGERRNVAKSITKAMKRERTGGEKMMYALEAYKKGFKVKKFGFDSLPEYRFNRYGGTKK